MHKIESTAVYGSTSIAVPSCIEEGTSEHVQKGELSPWTVKILDWTWIHVIMTGLVFICGLRFMTSLSDVSADSIVHLNQNLLVESVNKDSSNTYDIAFRPKSGIENSSVIGYFGKKGFIKFCDKPYVTVKLYKDIFMVKIDSVDGNCKNSNVTEAVTFHIHMGEGEEAHAYKVVCEDEETKEECDVYNEDATPPAVAVANTVTTITSPQISSRQYGDKCQYGETMNMNDCLVSGNNNFFFCLYPGKLVGKDRKGHVFWSQDVAGATSCIMQYDGNFVCYNGKIPTWATKTSNGNNYEGAHPTFITMQYDRNIVLYNWQIKIYLHPWEYVAIWSSNTVGGVKEDESCFPGDAKVEVYNKGVVSMKDLAYGDLVQTVDKRGSVQFQEVYFFGHRDPSAVSEYVNLQSAGGRVLQLSPTHFARVCASHCSADSLRAGLTVLRHVYAKDVSVGDLVGTVGAGGVVSFSAVERVWRSLETGLYNPYVRGGDILVEGTVASVHSEWVLDSVPFLKSEWLPHVYEALFFPLYLIYKAIGPEYSEQAVSWLGVHEHRQTGVLSAHCGVEALVAVYLLLMVVPTSVLYCSGGLVGKRSVQA